MKDSKKKYNPPNIGDRLSLPTQKPTSLPIDYGRHISHPDEERRSETAQYILYTTYFEGYRN